MILIISMSRQIIHLYFPHILSTACSILFFNGHYPGVFEKNGGIMGRLGSGGI